jgi:cation transport regulator ChaB
MPYRTNAALPDGVKNVLPAAAQTIWRTVANSAEKTYGDDPERVARTAWAALKNAGWAKGDDGAWHKVSKEELEPFTIRKIDPERRLVFGWVSVCVLKSGEEVTDLEGDRIDMEDYEDAVYEFNLLGREANAVHQGETIGYLAESLFITKEKLAAMGLPEDALPLGWWAGWKVFDDAGWQKVVSGEYRAFSIEGTAIREPD